QPGAAALQTPRLRTCGYQRRLSADALGAARLSGEHGFIGEAARSTRDWNQEDVQRFGQSIVPQAIDPLGQKHILRPVEVEREGVARQMRGSAFHHFADAYQLEIHRSFLRVS